MYHWVRLSLRRPSLRRATAIGWLLALGPVCAVPPACALHGALLRRRRRRRGGGGTGAAPARPLPQDRPPAVARPCSLQDPLPEEDEAAGPMAGPRQVDVAMVAARAPESRGGSLKN